MKFDLITLISLKDFKGVESERDQVHLIDSRAKKSV